MVNANEKWGSGKRNFPFGPLLMCRAAPPTTSTMEQQQKQQQQQKS